MQIESPDLIYWWSDTSPWLFRCPSNLRVCSFSPSFCLPDSCQIVQADALRDDLPPILGFLSSQVLSPLSPLMCVIHTISFLILLSISVTRQLPQQWLSSSSSYIKPNKPFFLTLLIASYSLLWGQNKTYYIDDFTGKGYTWLSNNQYSLLCSASIIQGILE